MREGKRKKERQRERTEGKTVRCREIIGLSGTRAWREASDACVFVCVCVSHERVLFSDKYIVLISVCGDRSLCMLSPSETQPVCERVCVCMWPIVRWQSHRASCRYALSHRVYLILHHMHTHAHTHPPTHTHTHTHTHNPGRPMLGQRTQGREGWEERVRGRVKVRTLSLLPHNIKWTFFTHIKASLENLCLYEGFI